MVLEALEPNTYNRKLPLDIGKQYLQAAGYMAEKGYLQIDSHGGNLMFRDGLPVIIDWGWGVMWKKYSSNKSLTGTIENYPYRTVNNYNGRSVRSMFGWQVRNMEGFQIGLNPDDQWDDVQAKIWLSVPGARYLLKGAQLTQTYEDEANPKPPAPTYLPGPGKPYKDPLGLF